MVTGQSMLSPHRAHVYVAPAVCGPDPAAQRAAAAMEFFEAHLKQLGWIWGNPFQADAGSVRRHLRCRAEGLRLCSVKGAIWW
jgi:hypothetical protein